VRPPPDALDLGENAIPDPRAVTVTKLGAKPFFVLLLVSIRTSGTKNKYFHSVKLVRKRFTCTIQYSSCPQLFNVPFFLHELVLQIWKFSLDDRFQQHFLFIELSTRKVHVTFGIVGTMVRKL
jgi:hypothetical protein